MIPRGEAVLRETIAGWLQRRFQLQSVNAECEVLPVNGTREALFAFAQAVVTEGPGAAVVSPNPFYQIYEGAALLPGRSPSLSTLPPAVAICRTLPPYRQVCGNAANCCISARTATPAVQS